MAVDLKGQEDSGQPVPLVFKHQRTYKLNFNPLVKQYFKLTFENFKMTNNHCMKS